MTKPKKPNTPLPNTAPEHSLPAVLPQQPFQLELFRLTDNAYTNAFDFYEMIPRFVVGGDRSRYYTSDGRIEEVSRDSNGRANPIERFYIVQGQGYNLTIKPAQIKQKDGKWQSVFPGVREEIIETVLYKLAIEKGYFASFGEIENTGVGSFTLFTSLYEIQKELRLSREAVSYSQAEIKEALKVLHEVVYEIRKASSNYDTEDFRIISEFAKFNKQYADDGKRATIFIRFNLKVTAAILSKKWRLINYKDIMSENSYLARWFRKRLGIAFTYANSAKTYNIKLSTVISSSGISPYDQMRDNLAFVKKTLKNLNIIHGDRLLIDKEHETNPETGRKILKDALFVIYPTVEFSTEQLKANKHAQKIASALPDEDGRALTDPDFERDLTPREREEKRRKYLKAQAREEAKRAR